MTEYTRRALLGSALAASGAALSDVEAAQAAAPAAGKQAPGVYRYKIGSFELTAVNDGIWDRPIDEKFVRNAPFADVQQALADAFLATDKLPISFTSLAVNTGTKLVLLDTGTGGQFFNIAPRSGTWNANLAAAGIDPKAVDVIAISHFHADHINGIKTKDNELLFPNAEIMVAAQEWAYWMEDANLNKASETARTVFLNTRRIFRDIAKDVKRFEPGAEIAPGIM